MSNNHGEGSEPAIPPMEADGMRHWQVAGGILFDERGLLLVENKRRNGDTDWSPPGGVIDRGETVVDGLTREVKEETGLEVSSWTGPVYRVEVTAPDAGFFLAVEAHRSNEVAGTVVIDDPDGIVISARFFDLDNAAVRLSAAQPWVVEPLLAHLTDGVADGRLFQYRVEGARNEERTVHRLHSF